jgi:hypothetical protein
MNITGRDGRASASWLLRTSSFGKAVTRSKQGHFGAFPRPAPSAHSAGIVVGLRSEVPMKGGLTSHEKTDFVKAA